ncbi:MAG: hypothetical protein IPL75_01235 [Acidobacteria bacterium]|nr:hypothetical protein [Acidobacteriota bacterium]
MGDITSTGAASPQVTATITRRAWDSSASVRDATKMLSRSGAFRLLSKNRTIAASSATAPFVTSCMTGAAAPSSTMRPTRESG